jgi:hypothetical protein
MRCDSLLGTRHFSLTHPDFWTKFLLSFADVEKLQLMVHMLTSASRYASLIAPPVTHTQVSDGVPIDVVAAASFYTR